MIISAMVCGDYLAEYLRGRVNPQSGWFVVVAVERFEVVENLIDKPR